MFLYMMLCQNYCPFLGLGVCLVKRKLQTIILLSKDRPSSMGLLTLYLNVNPLFMNNNLEVKLNN